jgi:anaerobic selenocysteine-containing dehydrogenase
MFEKGEDIEVEDSTDESDDDDFSIQRRNAIIVEAVEDINEQVIVKKTYNERLTELKIVLKQLLCEMIEYMKTINDKQFIKNLCDDIAIVLKTIGTQYGEMLTYSRQHSQGEERAHQVTNISEIEENIQRSGAGRNQHSYKRGASRASYDSDSDDELPERACMSAGPSSTQVCSQIAYAASSDSDEEEWEDDEEEEENAQKASNGFCSVERSPEPSSITPVDDIIDNYDISDNLETTCSQTKLFVIRSISGN